MNKIDLTLPSRATLPAQPPVGNIALKNAEKALVKYDQKLDEHRTNIDRLTAEISVQNRALKNQKLLYNLEEVTAEEITKIEQQITTLESSLDNEEAKLRELLPSRPILEQRLKDASVVNTEKQDERLRADHQVQFQITYEAVATAYEHMKLLQPLHLAVLDLSSGRQWANFADMFTELNAFFNRNIGYFQDLTETTESEED